MFSLYGDLPAPKSKNDGNESSETATPSSSAPPSTKPAGWSNMQQFRRPMMRKPTTQAKPKPLIPAGATIVSTTTVSKDPSPSPPPPAESTPPKPSSSPILRPLQTKSYHSTPDYGSRKKKKAMVQNQGPPPIDLYEDYDPLKPTDYEQYKEEMEILRQQRLRHSDDGDDIDDDDEDNRSPSPRHRK
ncbi:hypothetical protein [Absidia glauca]|uniref:Uncharacterized protein n=1 Tax=Absidia glauca TaxID=4829 RepID=A0A168SU93_ABSGL|nr:hypothetical protein [Absidia glauca]